MVEIVHISKNGQLLKIKEVSDMNRDQPYLGGAVRKTRLWSRHDKIETEMNVDVKNE